MHLYIGIYINSGLETVTKIVGYRYSGNQKNVDTGYRS